MSNDDINRSVDLSEILARTSGQALLQGGPYSGRIAPVPVSGNAEFPRYLCQPGRGNDLTMYHYVHVYRNVYQYFDHCTTMGLSAHGDVGPAAEISYQPASTRTLALVIISALLVGSVMVSLCLIALAAVVLL